MQISLIDKGQLRIPEHYLNKEIKKYDLPAISLLIDRYGIHFFKDLTEEALRKFYIEHREEFYNLLLQLWFLGFTFYGNLANLVNIDCDDTSEFVEVQTHQDPELSKILP